MYGPESSGLDAYISPILTNIAISFLPDVTECIARQVFPNVPVAAPSGVFNVWTRGDFLRIQAKKLANGEAPPLGGFASTSGNYTTARYGISSNWTSQDIAKARQRGQTAQQFKNAKVRYVTNQGVLMLEKETSDLIRSAGNWNQGVVGVSANPVAGTSTLQWDNTNSDPIGYVASVKQAFKLYSGLGLNTAIIPRQVMDKLLLHPAILQRIVYGGTPDRPAQVNQATVAGLFGIDKILVPEQVYNAAKPGQADAIQYIWGKDVWFGYTAANPGVDEPSAGYHFSWTGDTTAGLPAGVPTGEGPQNFGAVQNEQGLFILEYDTPRPRAHWIDSELWTTPNIVSKDIGFLFQGAIS